MNNYYYPYNWRNTNNVNLFNPKEGFEKGNMFENTYSGYKNYKPQELRPSSEEEKLKLHDAIHKKKIELNKLKMNTFGGGK